MKSCTVQLGLDNVLFLAEGEETCARYIKALNNSGVPYLPPLFDIELSLDGVLSQHNDSN